MISNILNFETDNTKFYDEQDEITTALGNSIPFKDNKKKSKPDLQLDISNDFDSFSNLNFECPFFEFDYNGNTVKFKNREELAAFVNDQVEYNEPYYVFNIPKKTHCVQIKMRNLESVCDYLLKFYQK